MCPTPVLSLARHTNVQLHPQSVLPHHTVGHENMSQPHVGSYQVCRSSLRILPPLHAGSGRDGSAPWAARRHRLRAKAHEPTALRAASGTGQVHRPACGRGTPPSRADLPRPSIARSDQVCVQWHRSGTKTCLRPRNAAQSRRPATAQHCQKRPGVRGSANSNDKSHRLALIV